VRNSGSTVPVSPYVQDLRNANIHAFCFLPLSRHALVLFEFPRQVSRCPGGCFTLFLPRLWRELIVGRNGAQSGSLCQDRRRGSFKSYSPPFSFLGVHRFTRQRETFPWNRLLQASGNSELGEAACDYRTRNIALGDDEPLWEKHNHARKLPHI